MLTLGMMDFLQHSAMIQQAQLNPLFSPEMLDHATAYAKLVTDELMTPDTTSVEVEVSGLSLDPYVPGSRGTADCVILDADTLTVVDLKYGRGVEVDATDNPQLKLYAVGVINRLLDNEQLAPPMVKLVIYQPRISATPSTFTVDTDQLLTWATVYVKPAAATAIELAQSPQTVQPSQCNPGPEQCRFCRALGTCVAAANRVFDDVEISPPMLTIEALASRFERAPLIEAWLKAAEETLTDALKRNKSVPGFKLVRANTTRRIVNQDEALLTLLDMGFDKETLTTTKLNGIGDLEKVVGKKELTAALKEFIQKPQGDAKLALSTDKRAAINAADMFEMQFPELKGKVKKGQVTY
jgi:hypothetical protein